MDGRSQWRRGVWGREVGPKAGEAIKSAFVQLAMRKAVEELLEAEVGDVLQLGYYQHRVRLAAVRGAAETAGEASGGHRGGRLRTI